MSDYIEISGRDIAEFRINNEKIFVMMRRGKIRIEASFPVQLEMIASNAFNLISSEYYVDGNGQTK